MDSAEEVTAEYEYILLQLLFVIHSMDKRPSLTSAKPIGVSVKNCNISDIFTENVCWKGTQDFWILPQAG